MVQKFKRFILRRKPRAIYALIFLTLSFLIIPSIHANASDYSRGWRDGCKNCCTTCANNAVQVSSVDFDISKKYVTDLFTYQKEWMVTEFFSNHMLPSLMLFTEQMTAGAMQQVVGIGMLLDAKHQLETQRLFQQMTAQAHKDYQPSEGMCTFGTLSRSLAASDFNASLTSSVLSSRMIQREVLSTDTIAASGASSDFLSRAKQFRELYCSAYDNGNGLTLLCPDGSAQPARINKDINFSETIEKPLTLGLDFTAGGNADHRANLHSNALSADEEDVMALANNLYAHTLPPVIPPSFLSDGDGKWDEQGLGAYMQLRALTAKRSVARNSYAELTAMKSQGGADVQPYLYAVMKEFGVREEDIPKFLGSKPSYYAQMEVLTRKLYQNPNFYTELYDKPANVKRKNVSMQAIDVMQRRDMYRSLLRSEAIMAVMLETALQDKQNTIAQRINGLSDSGEMIDLPE